MIRKSNAPKTLIGTICSILLGLGGLIATGTTTTQAQSSDGSDTVKKINELIEVLKPGKQKKKPTGGKNVRKVIVIDADGKEKIYYVDYDSSASLSVEFRKNSDQLTSRARTLLKVLATALSSEDLSGYSYMLAGHTDASGSDAYNQKLSERRALVVAQHLSTKFSIDASRLVPVGFGEKQLANPNSPRSSANRRVQVGLIVEAPTDSDRKTSQNDTEENKAADEKDGANELINN